jgi:hypothetical protein
MVPAKNPDINVSDGDAGGYILLLAWKVGSWRALRNWR